MKIKCSYLTFIKSIQEKYRRENMYEREFYFFKQNTNLTTVVLISFSKFVPISHWQTVVWRPWFSCCTALHVWLYDLDFCAALYSFLPQKMCPAPWKLWCTDSIKCCTFTSKIMPCCLKIHADVRTGTVWSSQNLCLLYRFFSLGNVPFGLIFNLSLSLLKFSQGFLLLSLNLFYSLFSPKTLFGMWTMNSICLSQILFVWVTSTSRSMA